MCKSKKIITQVIDPKNSNSPTSTPRKSSRKSSQGDRHSFNPSTTNYTNTQTTSSSYNDSSGSSISRRTSLSSLRDSLPERGHIYDFSEICTATNNFLSKRYSSSSSSVSWRCNLLGDDVIVFQRKFRRPIDSSELRDKLSLICKSHHTSLIKLRGAAVSGNYVYLVYDFVHGANLTDCLRNPRNPNFTVLSNWMSRIQIATDIAHGLDYVHNCTGLNLSFVHNHIKSTSIIVTEPSLNARICHFGTAELCGEIVKDEEIVDKLKNYKRSNSRLLRVEGTRGYMPPEFQITGVATQRSDVYAFGMVILELMSGEEPLKYRFGDDGRYERVSVIETAREAVDGGGGGGLGLRWWMDKRLKDSYPIEVAEKLARVGLECVDEDPEKRPGMGLVAGRVSKLYLESQIWADKMGVPTDFTVSFAPR